MSGRARNVSASTRTGNQMSCAIDERSPSLCLPSLSRGKSRPHIGDMGIRGRPRHLVNKLKIGSFRWSRGDRIPDLRVKAVLKWRAGTFFGESLNVLVWCLLVEKNAVTECVLKQTAGILSSQAHTGSDCRDGTCQWQYAKRRAPWISINSLGRGPMASRALHPPRALIELQS